MPKTDPRYGSPRWRKLTKEVQVRDLWTCQYCFRGSELTDHIVAVVHGGDFWDPANLAACCRSCNQGRRQNGEAWVPPTRRERVVQADSPRRLVTPFRRHRVPRIY
jgi:5-methylcytosine-specific restriction endonuclease McrA